MRQLYLLPVPLTLAILPGCPGPAATVKVEGVVTFSGQPVADAQVTFILDEKDGQAASGLTDAAGAFVVKAVPARYGIVIFKPQLGPHPLQSALPARYQDFTTTPFRCVVPTTERLVLDLRNDEQ